MHLLINTLPVNIFASFHCPPPARLSIEYHENQVVGPTHSNLHHGDRDDDEHDGDGLEAQNHPQLHGEGLLVLLLIQHYCISFTLNIQSPEEILHLFFFYLLPCQHCQQ